MKRILKSGWLLLLLGTVLSGCVKSEVIDEPAPGSDKVSVRFEVELPDVATPATRGIQNSTETAVTNFYVLIFDSATDQFVDKKIVPAAAITSANGPDNALEIKSFTTALIKSANAADTYNLVLLANIPASGALKTAVDGITVGIPRTTALAALTQTYSGNPTMPVPMASVPKAAVQIQEGMSTLTFDMIRMVARIDVELSASVAADYSVKQVLFYNYNTIGRVWTPNYSGTTTTGTTLPSNPGTSAAGSSYAVANTRSGGLALTDFQALMYAQEATVSTVASRPCIVIELEDATTGASMGFYRADFWSRTGTPQYLDILRNHRYLFTVTAVNGTGFTSPTDAYNSTPAGITTEVISIDESELKEIVVAGNYWLGLSSKNLKLSCAAQTDDTTILVKTNVAAGWSVVGVYDDAVCTIPHGGVWLTGASRSVDNLAVTALQNNSATASRTAYVKIKAGTMENVVTVIQAEKPSIRSLELLETTLDSHFDYRPLTVELNSLGLFTKVEILNTNGTTISGTPWLEFSSYDDYTDAYNALPTKDLLTSNIYDTSSGSLELHLYADEYITIGGADRKYLIRITTAQTTADLANPAFCSVVDTEITQKAIQSVGYFGGAFTSTDQIPYAKQLGVEYFIEHSMQFKSTDLTVFGLIWGFTGLTTGITDKVNGLAGTIILAERTDHGISGTLTRYNNYAARYCYDKNRDLNGDGVLDTTELVWYLPAQNQSLGMHIAKYGTEITFDSNISTASEANINYMWSVTGSWGQAHSTGTKNYPLSIRCVRDL